MRVLLFFVIGIILVLNFSFANYVITFNHYNERLKSYISYVLFDNYQVITDYQRFIFYRFDYPSIDVLREIYNLRGQTFPSFYKPILQEKKDKKKEKNKNLGTIAHIYKDDQVMVFMDYSTPEFYKFLDIQLRGFVVALEDNIQNLLNQLYDAEKIEFKTYFDYIKAFGNVNDDYTLLIAYPCNDSIFFEFLNTKQNKIRIFKINRYYNFSYFEKEYPRNELFKF